MTSDANERRPVLFENLLQRLVQSGRHCGFGLALVGLPQRVVLAEARLEVVRGELGGDVGGCAAAVAGVFAVGLAEELGFEGLVC